MIGLMKGMAHGHANRPFPHPVVSRLDSNGNGSLDLEDLAGTKLGDKLARKFDSAPAEASGGQTTISYSSFNASFQSGPDGFSLSVSIVQATIAIGAADAAGGEDGADVIEGDLAPIDDADEIDDDGGEDDISDDGSLVGDSTASALYEKAASGEAALELLEDIAEPQEEDLLA